MYYEDEDGRDESVIIKLLIIKHVGNKNYGPIMKQIVYNFCITEANNKVLIESNSLNLTPFSAPLLGHYDVRLFELGPE